MDYWTGFFGSVYIRLLLCPKMARQSTTEGEQIFLCECGRINLKMLVQEGVLLQINNISNIVMFFYIDWG